MTKSARTCALLLLVVVVATSRSLSAVVLAHRQRCCGKQDPGGDGRYRFSFDRNLHRRFHGGRVRRPKYHGSGCPPNSLVQVNSSDEASAAVSVLFSAFQAQTTETLLRDQKKCFINVELTVEPGMSVGIVHIDFRGFAYVPGDGASAAFARLRASYSMLGAHGLIAERTFGSGYTDDVYEGMDFNPVVWTPCAATAANRTATNATVVGGSNRTNTSALPSLAPGRATGLESYWIRIESRIVAQKARLVDEDVQIAIDSSDAMLAKGHLEYAMVARPCA